MEQYLNDIDTVLLRKNKVRIVRMYLEEGTRDHEHKVRNIGRGSLIEVPFHVSAAKDDPKRRMRAVGKNRGTLFNELVRDLLVYNPILYSILFRRLLGLFYPRPGKYNIYDAREKLRKLNEQYRFDLIVMHDIGTTDSQEIIEESNKLDVPYVFVNHYSNDRFRNVSIREQLGGAAGIAGVNAFGVPRWVRKRFVNLSDGIDTEFFSVENAKPLQVGKDLPIIFYPARILPVKGQMDLLKAAVNLKREGVQATLVFAGRTDSHEYEEELKKMTQESGLNEDVIFVGQLNVEELRDWYGISTVLGFPTYHQEGLGRITIEAQAMKVPPVAYIIGGTPEGIRHGKTGFLVKKGDLHTFTQRLKELLTDENKRKKMGEAGRKFVLENFSLDALAERHEKFYLSALTNARRNIPWGN